MEPNFDVYLSSLFWPTRLAGTALTNLRRVQVNGTYAFSEDRSLYRWNSGDWWLLAVSKFISLRENAPNTPSGDTFKVDDIQDGCNNAQNPDCDQR